MFSRILESERAACPAIQAGGKTPAQSRARPATSSPRWAADHAADVVGVALAAVGDDALADRVELGAEAVELLGGEFRWELRGAHRLPFVAGSEVDARSPSGALMQSWMSSSGSVEISPVSRFLTVPLSLRQVQVWQMPIRQPDCG